jgi:hypothetical protein
MKRKLKIMAKLLLTAAFAAVFASCSKDEPESPRAIEVQDKASLTQVVFADQTQGKSDVTFTTTGAWTSLITEKTSSAKATDPQPKPLEADAPIAWISISPDHGDKAGAYTVAITLTPNLTGADRAAVITITCEGTEVVISVTQKAENEDGTTVQVVNSGITGECTWTLTGAPGNYTLAISGNGAMENYDWDGSPWYQRRDDIKTAVIQDGVTTIGSGAFCGCRGLTDVTIPNSVQTIGVSAFSDCSGLTDVTISNSVQTIAGWAFEGCTNLTAVMIPNSVQAIDLWAFGGCSGLTTVTIGNSVTAIGENAFVFCTSLTVVTNLNPVPQQNIGNNVFENISALTLKVPESAVNDYKAAPVWGEFGNIIANE